MHINNKYYMLNIYCKSGLNRFWLSFWTALEFLPWKFNWHVLLLEFFGLKWWNKIKLIDRHFHTGVYKFLRNISANIWSLQKSTRLKLRTLSLIFQNITIPIVSIFHQIVSKNIFCCIKIRKSKWLRPILPFSSCQSSKTSGVIRFRVRGVSRTCISIWKEWGCLLGHSNWGIKIMFCGYGLKFSSPLRGTNSKTAKQS